MKAAAQLTSNVKVLNNQPVSKKGELPSVSFVDMVDTGTKKNLELLKQEN